MIGLIEQIRDSIVVSISACHADDPGSIPGRGVLCIIELFGVVPLGIFPFFASIKALWPNG